MSCTDKDSDTESFKSASSHNFSFVSVPSLSETLESHFSDVPENFNVVHINAQSIPAHVPEMLTNFDCKNVHAILISESWLKPCLPSTSYLLPNYDLIRNDRERGAGGGVAIYLRQSISYHIVDLSAQPPSPNAGEHLFIEIELSHNKLLLGVYYSPSSRINFFSSFERLLERLIPSYSHTIIMGDFNTCLLKTDSRASTFTSTVESCNLTILPLNATHNYPNSNPSLLDLILVSSAHLVAKHGQCSADDFSYHDLIFLSYKLRPPKPKPKILRQRNFNNMDLSKLRQDASIIDWSSLLSTDSIDEKVNIFNSKLTCLYNVHAPVRTIKIKHLPAPWLTAEIKVLISRKSTAKSRFKTRPTTINRDKYIAIRNICNKACRKAQRQYIHNSVENGDPSKVWKFLRTLGVGKSHTNTVPKTTNIDSLNLHFSSLSNYSQTCKANTLKYLSSLPTPDFRPFFFQQITACDVKKCVMSITSNAVGSDCISRNMIQPIIDEILPIICHILDHSLTNSVFPETWKEAQIIPIPKKSNPSSFSDYRPISVLSFLSKVLERLVHTQLTSYLTKNCLLNPYQSGFRAGHSTVSAMINVTDDIRLGMEHGKLTILSLLDFSNAFNTVDFDILLGILHTINISPTVIEWFRSYLLGRKQRVHVDEFFSSWYNTSAGVPQGGVLSPLLFTIFINSISKKLLSSYHLYADDLQIYTQAPLNNLSEAFATMNLDLARVCEWSSQYGLIVNPSKTKVVVVGSSRLHSRIDWSKLPDIKFNNVVLPISTSVKNLGILIDSTLSWGPQLREVSRKIFASAGSMRRLRNFLPTVTKVALAESLLLPILDYSDVSYLDITEEQLDKLERLQNFCIRFIFGLRKYDHVTEFRKLLKWLPIRLRRNSHILSMLYSILFNPFSPPYLKERFKFLSDTHLRSLRSSETLELMVPSHTTKFYDKSFTVQAVRLWNSLPISIRRAETLPAFKRMVKDHYLAS